MQDRLGKADARSGPSKGGTEGENVGRITKGGHSGNVSNHRTRTMECLSQRFTVEDPNRAEEGVSRFSDSIQLSSRSRDSVLVVARSESPVLKQVASPIVEFKSTSVTTVDLIKVSQ